MRVLLLSCAILAATASHGAAQTATSSPVILSSEQMDLVTAGRAIGRTESFATAFGNNTYADTVGEATASDGDKVDRVTASGTATARGDLLAETEVTSLSYSDGGDGSGAGVLVDTFGTGFGDGSASKSRTRTFAISTRRTDIAVGIGFSRATGSLDHEADASTSQLGDITVGRSVNIQTPRHSFARAVGVAINFK